MNDRSVMYPFLAQDAQAKVNSLLLDASAQPLFELLAYDEWVYIRRVSGVPTSIVSVVNENSEFFICGEPFFVSGKQRLTLQASSGQFLILKAKRREMLSWSDSASASDSNSPGQSFLYNTIFTAPVNPTPAGSWVYLNANLQWELATKGQCPNGMPFGWGASNPSYAGRYYSVEIALQDNGNGNQQGLIVPANSPLGTRTNGASHQFTINGTAVDGIATLGDEPYAQISNSVIANTMQSSYKSCRGWTVAIIQGVAGATGVGGYLSVIRRGY